jgi:hypothetical protein
VAGGAPAEGYSTQGTPRPGPGEMSEAARQMTQAYGSPAGPGGPQGAAGGAAARRPQQMLSDDSESDTSALFSESEVGLYKLNAVYCTHIYSLRKAPGFSHPGFKLLSNAACTATPRWRVIPPSISSRGPAAEEQQAE